MKRLFGCTLAIALSSSAVAWAYVRSRTNETPGVPIHWQGSCAFVVPDSAATADLPAATVFSILQTSMQSWMTGAAACSYLALNLDPPAPVEAHYDGVNVVKFRTDKWCHPNDAQSQDKCYEPQAAAITTVFFIDHPGDAHHGDIVDADIELNNINFTFVDVQPGVTSTPRPGTTIADLQNTVTHELGHLQGLDHTCKDAASPANEIDENGNPPPACTSIPIDQRVKITTATMYNQAAPGEIIKRMPKADDLAGICNAYPLASDPKMCARTDLHAFSSHGCDLGRGGAGLPGALFVLALYWLARRKEPASRVQ